MDRQAQIAKAGCATSTRLLGRVEPIITSMELLHPVAAELRGFANLFPSWEEFGAILARNLAAGKFALFHTPSKETCVGTILTRVFISDTQVLLHPGPVHHRGSAQPWFKGRGAGQPVRR